MKSCIKISYRIDVKSRNCYICINNNIMCLMKNKSLLVIDEEN
jgi:hypothetical protein